MTKSKQLRHRPLVLVVDDQEINRDTLGIILEDDYDILYAENGKEALALVREHQDELSIVLLDLMMPVMNGFEVMEVMRSVEAFSRIPIIVLTADKSAELRALQMGAYDFITKPFDAHEVILARVKRITELVDGRQLISAAEHDRLSLLYTRSFFFEYAERLFRYNKDLQLDAIVLNIEQFHSINDLNGREFGDEVLRVLGDEIRAFLSETEGIGGRTEGDRFAIYCTAQPDYRALLDRFQKRLDGISDKVSIHLRMGVNPWQEGVAPAALFDRARAACSKVRGDFQNPLM
ncbi:MAG: response regulator, partial [Oscillospiraceae bacterium]|nr:response regulator [Oscillospiraceae bacterium]